MDLFERRLRVAHVPRTQQGTRGAGRLFRGNGAGVQFTLVADSRWQPYSSRLSCHLLKNTGEARRVGGASWRSAACLNGNIARLISTSIAHKAMNSTSSTLPVGGGWELVGITSNNMAYLKREVADVAAAAHAGGQTLAASERPNGYEAEDGRAEVKVKYRDPVTNETWTGRGRMATWLKRKQDAGEDIEEYLV